jgi:hypothetical protein
LEIDHTKATFVISVLKVDMKIVGLVLLISISFFVNKTAQANKSVSEITCLYESNRKLSNVLLKSKFQPGAYKTYWV